MFADAGYQYGWGILVGILLYVLVIAVAVFIGYLLIRTAILRALNSHYKTVRLFEMTGEWAPRYQGGKMPRDVDGSS